jgi:hypothetical protein
MGKFDKTWKGMIDELMLDEGDTMTDRDKYFIASLHRQSDTSRFGWQPTTSQMTWLNDVYLKVFGG